MSVNESDIFEDNTLFIQGNILKNTIANINAEFNSLFAETFKNTDNYREIFQDLE